MQYGITFLNGDPLFPPAFFAPGSAGAPSIAFAGKRTGLFLAGTNGIGFSVGGAEVARFAPTSGNLLLGGLTADGTGLLQFPASAVAAGGITFGADIQVFRQAAGQLVFNGPGGSAYLFFAAGAGSIAFFGAIGDSFYLYNATATGSIYFGVNGGADVAVRIVPTKAMFLFGDLWLNNPYVAGVVAPTGTIQIADSTGQLYRVSCAL